jgi:hypothetical protein
MAAKGDKAKVKRAAERSLQRALREERLAIAAIVKVFLLEVPDPGRVLARLDAMVRAAEQNPRTPATVRRQLIDATRFVRTAIERERGKPQSLLDPHVEHVSPAAVDKLVATTDGPQQLGLVGNESVLGDVEAAHEQRVTTIAVVHKALVEILREKGAASDVELHSYYLEANQEGALPPQSLKAVTDRRRELVAAGRVVSVGQRAGTARWDIVERGLIAEAG